MRTLTFSINNDGDSIAVIPDEACFVFNPNFIEINSSVPNAVFDISVSLQTSESVDSQYAIKASMYNCKCKIYISSLLELLFTNYLFNRSAEVKVEVSINDTNCFSFTTIAIWGNLALGECFGSMRLKYPDTNYRRYERNLIWFRKYPFTLSLFRHNNDMEFQSSVDGGLYTPNPINSATTRNIGFNEVVPAILFPKVNENVVVKYTITGTDNLIGVFDKTFDHTFHDGSGSDSTILTKLKVCDDSAGYYLRWVDRHGYLQYFLFVKGNRTYKNTPESIDIDEDISIRGMYFSNLARVRHIDVKTTNKCCAVNLPFEIYEYVLTIFTSPIVDWYLGMDSNGTEVWQPVKISASSIVFSPKQVLNDIEFDFTTQIVNAQTL